MEQYYGNSPSYCLLSSGNEPAGNFMAWENAFVEHWIARDPRRVYTGSTGWGAGGQYTISFARGLTWKSQRPESMTDYARNVAFSRGPFLSHETGQWCVFPDFNEIRKYTGVNKALNFEIFKEILEENDLGERGHDFYMASGKLQALMYKHELEKHLRTDGYAGFQLLSLNDYSGQGSALVGVTDVFFDPKEYISVDEWRRFCNTTVPLARMEKFVFTSADTLRAEMQAAHFGAEPLRGVEVTYKITNQYRTVVASGSLGKKDLEIGNSGEFDGHVLTGSAFRADRAVCDDHIAGEHLCVHTAAGADADEGIRAEHVQLLHGDGGGGASDAGGGDGNGHAKEGAGDGLVFPVIGDEPGIVKAGADGLHPSGIPGKEHIAAHIALFHIDMVHLLFVHGDMPSFQISTSRPSLALR